MNPTSPPRNQKARRLPSPYDRSSLAPKGHRAGTLRCTGTGWIRLGSPTGKSPRLLPPWGQAARGDPLPQPRGYPPIGTFVAIARDIGWTEDDLRRLELDQVKRHTATVITQAPSPRLLQPKKSKVKTRPDPATRPRGAGCGWELTVSSRLGSGNPSVPHPHDHLLAPFPSWSIHTDSSSRVCPLRPRGWRNGLNRSGICGRKPRPPRHG